MTLRELLHAVKKRLISDWDHSCFVAACQINSQRTSEQGLVDPSDLHPIRRNRKRKNHVTGLRLTPDAVEAIAMGLKSPIARQS